MRTRSIITPLLVIVAGAILALAGCGGSNPAASGGGGTGGGSGGVTAPAAPTGVTATAGNQQNTISWTAVTGATSYNIYGGTASGSAVKGGTKIASATASPYIHSGLTNGTPYYYVVTAVNGQGESAASNLINATPSPTTPPAPPTGVTATTQSATQIDVNWTNATGATGYNIYRSIASSTAIQVNTAGPVAAGPFANTGLSPGTTYYYVVTALNANGASALSQEASAATTPDAPTGLGATPASSTQINLSWTAASCAASYYNVYRSTTAGFTVSAANKVGSSTWATFNDTGLTANTAYYYKVTAVNAGGESVPSTEATATTPAPAPTGVTATTQSATQIDINWNGVTGATGYNIYRSTTSPVASSAANKVNTAGPVAAGPFGNTGLAPGTTYYYVVTALNANGASALSQEASAATLPAAPTGLSATPTSATQINMNWTAAPGAASYNVYRSTTAGFTVSAANKAGSSTGATFNDTGLTANTAYYYKVTAVNAGGESVPSTEATATTPAPAPTGVTATTQSATQIDINWNGVTGATGYNIYRSTTSPVASSTANKINTAGSALADTGLSSGTTYYYVVTALNGNGESPLSQEASAATVPAAPTGLSATPTSSSQINLNWTAATGTASYNVYRATTAGFTVSAANKVGSNTGATFNDTGLTGNTTYYYKVTAVNAGGESAPSTEAMATTPALPAAPVRVAATPGTSQNSISWGTVPGPISYNIYWSTAAGVTKANGTLITGATPPYMHAGLTNGATYYYVVTAVNANGESAESAEARAKPDYGFTWTAGTYGTANYNIYCITWSGRQFVAAGGSGTILTSPDGVTWTPRTSGTATDLMGVAWSGSQFVVVGAPAPMTGRATILTSTDGINWTARTSTTTALDGVVWSGLGSRFVAVGWGILTSPDGVTWTAQTSGTTKYLFDVDWSGSEFVAVGQSGTILTSPDGVAWTARTSGTTNDLFGVAWLGGRYVAVGTGGTILTSPDGATWTARTSGTTNLLYEVDWSGSQFVAVGDMGTILTSPDGVTWTAQASGTVRYLGDVTWWWSPGARGFVAVGGSGTILTSP